MCCSHLIDHVLELSLGGVLSQRTHDSPQLLGCDGAVTILVEKGESLLKLGNLLFRQLICVRKKSSTHQLTRDRKERADEPHGSRDDSNCRSAPLSPRYPPEFLIVSQSNHPKADY